MEDLSMTSLKSVASVFAFAALAATGSAMTAAADSAKELRVTPLKAINLDVGVKRAIGYYLADNGNCNLTVLLSDVFLEGEGTTPSASRVSVKVAGGTSAQVDTIDGTGMSFTCSARANDMTVRVFERIAQSPYRPRVSTP
jgi:hypothetical protein